MSGNTHNLFQEAQVMYQGHVSNIGWQSRVSDEQAVGTTGQGLSMEAACIRQHDPEYSGSISYRVGCTYQVLAGSLVGEQMVCRLGQQDFQNV